MLFFPLGAFFRDSIVRFYIMQFHKCLHNEIKKIIPQFWSSLGQPIMSVWHKKVNNKKGDYRRQKIIGKTRVPFSIWRRMCILYDNVHVSIWYSLPSVNHKSEANGCNSLDNCNRCKIDVMQIETMHSFEIIIQEKICTERHFEAKYCDSEEFPMGAKQQWEKI